MITNQKTITINQPIEEVFAYISDFQNGPEWQSGLVEVCRLTKGPLGTGTQFSSVRKFMGRKLESRIEFVAYEKNRRIAFRSVSGPSPFRQSFLFEATVEGTKISTEFELETTGLMGLAEPLIASSVRREMDANFADLKELLESRVPEAFELLE